MNNGKASTIPFGEFGQSRVLVSKRQSSVTYGADQAVRSLLRRGNSLRNGGGQRRG